MEDISSLIKEAKPLYFARKRRNKIVKSSLVGVALLWVGIFAYTPKSTPYTYYWDTEFDISDNISVIEEMGLPTDEYGLLMVG